MRVEAYAASIPRDKRAQNEDAFLIGRGTVPFAAVADGAGAAQLAAKKVLNLFEKLIREVSPEDLKVGATWARILRVLDSSLLGSAESTLSAVAILDGLAGGMNVGDSAVYHYAQDRGLRAHLCGQKTSRLGSGKAEAEMFLLRPAPNDLLFLMTDGMRTCSVRTLERTIQKHLLGDFADLPHALIQAARYGDPIDDMTVVAMKLKPIASLGKRG